MRWVAAVTLTVGTPTTAQAGETNGRMSSSKPSIRSSIHGRVTWKGGSSGGWAGGRGYRHRRNGGEAHDIAGEGVILLTFIDLSDPTSQHNLPPYTHGTTHKVAKIPCPDTEDANRQAEELSRT